MVDIDVSRNFESEQTASRKFEDLQTNIFELYGKKSPLPPVLRCRNATQTSVVLEWDPMELATAELRSLSLFRNGVKAGNVPRDKLSTKISGLAIDTQYTFQLVLRTTAGTYSSERLSIRTQKMTDLTGITITPGILPHELREDIERTATRISAKVIDTVRIDTTHFVCTEGRGPAWEKAVEMNVPVVVPDWLKGCEREGRIVGVRGYYLDADPKTRQIGPSVSQQTAQQQQQQQRQRAEEEAQQQERQRQEEEDQNRAQQRLEDEAATRRRDAQQAQQLGAPTHVQRQSSISILGTQPRDDGPIIEHTPPTPEQVQHNREDIGERAASPSSPSKRSSYPSAEQAESDGEGYGPGSAGRYGETHETVETNSDDREDRAVQTPATEQRTDDDQSEASFATDAGGRRDSDQKLPDRSRDHVQKEGPDGDGEDDTERETPQESRFDEVSL